MAFAPLNLAPGTHKRFGHAPSSAVTFLLWPGSVHPCKVPLFLDLRQLKDRAQPNPAFNPDPAAAALWQSGSS